MKQSDIKSCAGCGEGVAHDNNIMFFRLRATYLVIDVGAVQRHSGLEMMLGGNAAIAAAMGLDEDIAQPLYERDFLLCLECSMKPFAQIIEGINEKNEREESSA